MKLVGIHTQSQGSGKTFFSIALADALSRQKKAGRVVLIDADDTNNGAGTSSTLLKQKPLRKRGFECVTLEEWKEGKLTADTAVIDTSRSPSNGIKSSLKEDCNAVLIPCIDDDKSYAAAEDALWDMRQAKTDFMIVPNCLGGSNSDKIRDHFKPSRAKTSTVAIPDEPLMAKLFAAGDLLIDAQRGDADDALAAIHRFDKLAAEVLNQLGVSA